MHAILVTIGTDGDVFPYVGLGARLRRRGHRVTLAGPETYQGLAAQHWLRFYCLAETGNSSNKSSKRPNMRNKMPGAVLSGRLVAIPSMVSPPRMHAGTAGQVLLLLPLNSVPPSRFTLP